MHTCDLHQRLNCVYYFGLGFQIFTQGVINHDVVSKQSHKNVNKNVNFKKKKKIYFGTTQYFNNKFFYRP